MKIEDIDVDSSINSVKDLLKKEKDLSPALRSALEVLLVLVALLLNRMTLNSKNSSKPPSTDPNRKKLSRQGQSSRKPGGQKGRNGATLQPVADPDEVEVLVIDRRTLPKGPQYREAGHESRQVIDIDIARFVTEYRAQILEDNQGNRFVAAFPDGVNRAVQYGLNLKANAVYMSQHQLIPYDRIRDHFQDQMHIPVSAGSVFNFNKEAYERLASFGQWAKTQLARSDEVIGGEPAAMFAVDRYDELFHDDPENWCQLALAAPDRRLLELLEQHLPREQRLFDETFYQMARLLEVAHPDLESIAERVQKAQAETQARRAAFRRGEWVNQTLMLELKCPECGDSNEYKVQHVVVNPDSKDTDLILADEFPCASCGHWVDFEFTSGAHMAMTAELLKLAADSDEGHADQSKALIMAEALYNGQRLPVGEVVSRCKVAVANNPGSIVDWLRLGYCYDHVLSRPRYGLGYVEQALVLEPNAVEAVLQKADAIAMQGDKAAAFQLLDQALESKEHWRFFLTDVVGPAQLTAQFAHSYNELLRGLGRSDRASLHASFHGASKKVGRNDPCPCGSGRKYKKCCLAKH